MKDKKSDNKEVFYLMYKKPFVKAYFYEILHEAADIAKLTLNDVVLDFGCGSKKLSKIFFNIKFYNYDIDENYNETKDYTKLNPSVIFALSVLEHLTEQELIKTLGNFKKMDNLKRLILSTPNDNFLSKFLSFIVGATKYRDEQHKLDKKRIYEILKDKGFVLKEKKNVWFLSEITKWCIN